ncbi:MAG: ABC transporter substrate-binding protein [Candidatus Hydrothermia bacterium]
MRKVLVLINILLFAVLVFILIQPQIQAARVKEIKVIYARNTAALPFFVANEMGYFDSLKLKVSMEEVDRAGEEVERVGRGALGAGFGSSWDQFALKASADPTIFRIIYNAKSSVDNPQTALVSHKTKGIRTFKDLSRKGIKIGYLKDTRQAEMLKYILAAEKISENNYSLMAFTANEMIDTMTLKFVDVMLVSEPVRSYLISKGIVNVVEDGVLERRVMTPFLVGLGYTSKVNVQLNKDGVARLVNALNMAIDLIRKDPQKAQEILRKYVNIEEPITINLPVYEKYSEITDVADIKRTVQKFMEMQFLFREVDFTNSILKREDIQK